MHLYEIFDPRDGRTLRVVPFAWLARFITRGTGLDYSRIGEGWC